MSESSTTRRRIPTALALLLRLALWPLVIVLGVTAIAPQWLELIHPKPTPWEMAEVRDKADRAEATNRPNRVVLALAAHRQRAQRCLDDFKAVAPRELWYGKAVVLNVVSGNCLHDCKFAKALLNSKSSDDPALGIAFTLVSDGSDAATYARGSGLSTFVVPSCGGVMAPAENAIVVRSRDYMAFDIDEKITMTAEGRLYYAGEQETSLRLMDASLKGGIQNSFLAYVRAAYAARCKSTISDCVEIRRDIEERYAFDDSHRDPSQ
ncbi:MAG: hypothetical protein ABI304_07515 [Rudaea sp.]